jgi:hypothetical protein
MLPVVMYSKAETEEVATSPVTWTAPTFERLGDVEGFRPAEAEPTTGDFAKPIVTIRRRWCSDRIVGRDGVLVVIGSADRTPLRVTALRRFGSNVGLAQARASSVADLLFPDARPKAMILLPGAPETTPTEQVSTQSGFEHDRSVSVWAFWQPGAPSVGQHAPECAD